MNYDERNEPELPPFIQKRKEREEQQKSRLISWNTIEQDRNLLERCFKLPSARKEG